MNILFLDQSGKLGGAELCLLDIASYFHPNCKVLLLSDGPFAQALYEHGIKAEVLASTTVNVRKGSNLLQGTAGLAQAMPTIARVVAQAKNYDLIYANTPKALIVGALASILCNRPLVYHLHDIISADHFSAVNRRILVALASRAALVIANSKASKAAFIKAGGRVQYLNVVYNGFNLSAYEVPQESRQALRQSLQLGESFIVGHFSRLAPWKGQHILIEALSQCPETVKALLVGDALFGEEDYVASLHHLVQDLGLQDRVKFLGFRQDIPQLMTACDLVVHSSTAPEPFGRVIVEAMLSGTPVIAAAAGGAMELIDHGYTGWLCPPSDAPALAKQIFSVLAQPEISKTIAQTAQQRATTCFSGKCINQQIGCLLNYLSR